MYVYRQTIHVKTGRAQEYLALEIEGWKQSGATFYLPQTGPLEVLEVEWEFESMAAAEGVAAELVRLQKTFPKPEYLEKHDELILDITTQIWYKE